MTEAAEKLGISQPTLSAREGKRQSPSVDGLEKMSDLYMGCPSKNTNLLEGLYPP